MWGLAALGIVAFSIALERIIDINRRTDYDAGTLFDSLKNLLLEKKFDQAYSICCSGKRRALPRVLGAGINKMNIEPALVVGAMTEESVHMASHLEKRLNLLVMFGNTSTLLGLLGTVFGLIMSFAAVGKPGVAAVEKSALLANGISAAMNATLVGLSISIPCVLVYAWLRARVDIALQEIDRYAIAILKILNPPSIKDKSLSTISRRKEEEEPADTDVTPMLNLMVLLIPFLLTQSEFTKIGAIEMKLPEASQGAGGGAGGEDQQQVAKLDLGIVITSKGFNIFSYFKTDSATTQSAGTATQLPDIGLKNNEYDFEELNKRLSEIKKKVLVEIVRPYKPSVSTNSSLAELYSSFSKLPPAGISNFADNDAVKIVAEEKITYKTVVAVMDAARGAHTDDGNVTMFPNVSIAGGIIQ